MRKPETIEIEPATHPNHAVLMRRVRRDAGLTSRHRYASPLLGQGTFKRCIAESLGQKSSKTTEIYKYVSQVAVKCTQSTLNKRMLSKKETST
jgi:hypothetical protein